jgi:hypothetical protein
MYGIEVKKKKFFQKHPKTDKSIDKEKRRECVCLLCNRAFSVTKVDQERTNSNSKQR